MGKHFHIVALALSAMLLASCSPPSAPPAERMRQSPPPAATAEPAPAATGNGLPIGSAETPVEAARPLAQVFRGTGTFVAREPAHVSRTSVTASGDITLNFVNADVRDVAKAVLGDFLKLNYIVDANVKGVVTIKTSHPLARPDVLPIVEQALRLTGVTIVQSAGVYKVIAAADAPRLEGAPLDDARRSASRPGFGIAIVPLNYISPADMQRLLEPLLPRAAILLTDPVRHVLVIGGTEQERSTILDDVALFDVDWLSGMSFALYSPKSVDANELTRELQEIIGGRDSPVASMVRLVPIDRLNAVLAISPQPKYLDQLSAWVERLDHPAQSIDQRLYVYHVQNGRASDLAAVLRRVLAKKRYKKILAAVPVVVPGRIVAPPPPMPPGTMRPRSGGGDRPDSPSPPPSSRAPPDAPDISGGDVDLGRDSVNITADETTNALVIRATPREYTFIEAALSQLDTVPLQVLLEAAVAEVTLTNDLKYGIQYFFQSGNHQTFRTDSSSSAITPADLPGFAYIFSGGNNIKVILSALESVTRVDVLSAPDVLVLNNQTARLQVGDQVPIATQQATSVLTPGAPIVNSIEFRDTGVILKVTPRVNQGGMVMMDITQEVSDVSTTTTSALNSPTINERKISSTVAVRDGETIALGGLIKDSKTRTKDGIPLLQDIPLLGALFRSTADQDTRTELIVLITPHVVENLQKARSVTAELRRKLRATEPLLHDRK